MDCLCTGKGNEIVLVSHVTISLILDDDVRMNFSLSISTSDFAWKMALALQ